MELELRSGKENCLKVAQALTSAMKPFNLGCWSSSGSRAGIRNEQRYLYGCILGVPRHAILLLVPPAWNAETGRWNLVDETVEKIHKLSTRGQGSRGLGLQDNAVYGLAPLHRENLRSLLLCYNVCLHNLGQTVAYTYWKLGGDYTHWRYLLLLRQLE